MFKQVIVVNKRLDMSPGKLGAMVAHGATSFFCEWFKQNVATSNSTWTEYLIKSTAGLDKELYAQWIAGSFTKIVLQIENEEEMKKLIEKAHRFGMVNNKDFFNIVDESTEFLDIPQWAAIAFRPMEAEEIDPITGELDLYSKSIPDIKEILGSGFENFFKVTVRQTEEQDRYNEFYLLLVRNTVESAEILVENEYKWINLSNGTILAPDFATREEAITWVTVNGDYKIESVGEMFGETSRNRRL